MFLRTLTLVDYANFEHMEFNFFNELIPSRKVTLLIGENGAGKSNVLEAIATLLSWFVARLRSEKASGNPILERKIRLGKPAAFLEVSVHCEEKDFAWHLVKTRKGQRTSRESSLKGASALATIFAERYTNNPGTTSLPMIAYYPAERYLLDIPKRVVTHHEFLPIDGYEESITKGIDFRRFFEWFRNWDDAKNELISDISSYLPYLEPSKLRGGSLYGAINKEKLQKENPELAEKFEFAFSKQFTSVLKAIMTFLPGYSNLRVTRRPRLQMCIDKDGKTFDILQLSQGERSLLALVADIAYRLAIMNPTSEDPLHGKGIVLIDEIDLHLHPRWQRSVIRNLQTTFPNCQFIITTHSPLVVSDPQEVQVFLLEEGSTRELDNLYGMDIEQVLFEIMDTPLRHEPLQEKLNDLMDAIQDKKFNKAKKLRNELLQVLPKDHRELMRADIFLRRMEALNAAHREA